MNKIPIPRLSDFLFFLLFISVLISGPKMLNIDGDLPRHLLMGKVVLETGNIPTQELFSYVYENRPYTPHEWLAGVIYYLMYLTLGLNGVVFLASLLIAFAFWMLYSEAVAQKTSFLFTFLLMLLGAMVTSIHWITRPHLFTMLLLAVWVIFVDRLSRGIIVRRWIFPALMFFWANIHAEYIAGFLVLIAYIAGSVSNYIFTRSYDAVRTVRKLISITFLSFFASMINPVGLKAWDVVVGYLRNRYLLARIVETRPPDFTRPEYFPLLILLGIAVVLMVTRRDKFSPAHFFLLAGFGVMSLLSARNAHLAGLIFPFVLSISLIGTSHFQRMERVEATIKRMEIQAKGGIWPIIVTLLIGILALAGPMGRLNRFEPSIFPVNAVRWLEAHPQEGRMFNAFDWGGYILFHLWPEQKVFIESQMDVTGDATRQYETILTLQEGWQDIFDQYKITWAIIPVNWPLTYELMAQGWETAYQDQTTVILVK